MHRPLLRVLTVGGYFAATLFAQDISGTWQGTLSPPNMNRDLRVVMKISEGDGGAWKATMYSIDQGIGIRGRELSTGNIPLSSLIAFAYGVHARQIIGAPAWADDDRYDILAQPDGEGQPSEKQWKTMLQKMLADRFKLTFHHEKRGLSVYAITVAKTGPKLTKSGGDPNGLPGIGFGKLGMMNATNANMSDLAGVFQAAVLDRPVVDQTGISGRFDFRLKSTPDETQFTGMGLKVPPPSDNADAPPDLFTALQEQLGLKLTATKAPVDVLVNDRAEKPSEN